MWSFAAVVLLSAGCADGPPGPGLSEPIVVGGWVSGGVQIDDEILVVVNPHPRPDPPSVEILVISAETERVLSSTEVTGPSAIDGVAAFDGRLLFRTGERLPGLEVQEREGGPGGIDQVGDWLVVVDLETMAPVEQYWLPVSGSRVDPLLVFDGVVWLLGDGYARKAIDLRTGENRAYRPLSDGTIVDVRRIDDQLQVVRHDRILRFELSTGDLVVEHFFGNDPEARFLPGSGFRYHDDGFWMSGLGRDDWDRVYRYDVESGEMTGPPRPAAELPTVSFEMDDHRWELSRPGEVFPLPYRASIEPEPGDVWRLVDRTSGEPIGRYDLGDWSPRFATDGRLWLSRPRPDGAGHELASLVVG